MYNKSEAMGILKLRLYTFVVALILLCSPIWASAQYTSTETAENNPAINADEEIQREIKRSKSTSQVLTTDQLQLYNDRTIEETMARLVGVQMRGLGQFNIRGVGGAGRGLYNVTLNGQRMSTTGKGNRSIDLGGISTDLISKVEIVKVLSPDMDADALGGHINLKTHRPIRGQRQLNIIYGGGFDTRYGEYLNPESRTSVQYSETYSDEISVSAGFTHQLNTFAWERLGINYDLADFGSGSVDVIESISPSLNTSERNNIGGHLVFNYQPTSTTDLYVNSYFNTGSRDVIQHRLTMSANGDWINQFETGATGNQGTYGYNINLRDENINQVLVQSGINQQLSSMELGLRIGWSHSKLQEEHIALPFQMSGLNYSVNMDTPNRPTLEVIDTQIRTQDLRIAPLNEIAQEHFDNTFTGNIDLEIPFDAGFIKFGTGAVITYKDGDYRDTDFTVLGGVNMSRFQMDGNKTFSVLDRNAYSIPWYILPENAKNYFDVNQPIFNREINLQRLNSDIWNYESFEGIYSGYGMVSYDFEFMKLMGGIRLEHTAANYSGYDVLFSNIGFHASTVDTNASISYTYLFPNLQVGFVPTDQSNITIAYSRSIARHDYDILTPFSLQHIMDETLFLGNPDLSPMMSDNIDLMIGHNLGISGQLGIGFFYKNISNFLIERTRTIEGGEFDGYVERTFDTSTENTDLYGIELSWQQNYAFLPGIFANFGTYADYTWTNSNYNVEFRDDDVRLPGQSPHVVNAAINYSQGRFTGQVAYHWTAESLVYIAETLSPVPSVSSQMYRDRYEDGYSDLSASVRFRITDNFRLWADASNLLRNEMVQYVESRSIYALQTDSINSRTLRLGIRFDL